MDAALGISTVFSSSRVAWIWPSGDFFFLVIAKGGFDQAEEAEEDQQDTDHQQRAFHGGTLSQKMGTEEARQVSVSGHTPAPRSVQGVESLRGNTTNERQQRQQLF
jgi:hypothetical protein